MYGEMGNYGRLGDTCAVVGQPNNLVKFVNLDFENLTFLANLYLLLHFSMKLEGILN